MTSFYSIIIKQCTLLMLLLLSINILSQNTVNIGKASYAEFPPSTAENQNAYRYSYKQLKAKYPFYLHKNAQGLPVPTNDWWTDAIFSQYAGDMWAYPHAVSADSLGINIFYPDGFEEGKLSKNNFLEIKGTSDGINQDFTPHSAKPSNWGDLNMQFRCEDSIGHYMDVTISHGSPFVWIELNGIKPILSARSKATVIDAEGTILSSFPALNNIFILQIGSKFYGIHTSQGTILEQKDGNLHLNTPDDKNYLVISLLPDNSFLKTYDTYARNKLINTTFEYSYNAEKGQVTTTFIAHTSNLGSNKNGKPTIISFQPHHYRTTATTVNFIEKANYVTHLGEMKTAIGNNFSFSYTFTGLPPHLGIPEHMTPEQTKRLNEMVNNFQTTKYGTNTYNKVLDELSEIMLIARQINHPKYVEIKASLKNELVDWLSYNTDTDTNETSKYFATYPQYGALIGFPAGYDSQAFNDQHFHYGYYVLAASRLMMVDEEFKINYKEMVKLIAKNYANWERWNGVTQEQKFPYLRTFDPYAGHSWASGMSYATGPDQESTSEAIMSWFGLFNLGLALNDTNLISLGAMGYTLESETTLDYYFNLYGNSFPESYQHKYVGILHAGAIMHDTWFSKDPAWIFGIQSVPSAHYCSYLARDEKQAEIILESAIQQRVNSSFIDTSDFYSNIISMGPQLGYYFLGNYANFKPNEALIVQDKLFENENDDWKWRSQVVINYNLTNATITYGKPAKDYHTSLPGGTVYKNNNGVITYIIYNHTTTDKEVEIFKNNKAIDTVRVNAGEFYCKKAN